MKADRLTRECVAYLKRNHQELLRVHSVFHKAINLIDEDRRLIALVDSSRDLGPNSIQLEFDATLNGLLPGDLVEVDGDQLIFQRSGLVVDLSELKPDNLTIRKLSLCLDPVVMKQRFQVLKQVIIDFGSHDGLAPLIDPSLPSNNYSSFVEQKIHELLDWLNNNQAKQLRNGLSGILGFGPGLTPSTDDFLVGLTSVAYVLSKHSDLEVYTVLTDDLPKIALGKTTIISEEMIRLASLGQVSRSYNSFLAGLLGKREVPLTQLAQKVIETGASSGTDFLFGVYSAHQLVDNFLGGNDATSPSQKE